MEPEMYLGALALGLAACALLLLAFRSVLRRSIHEFVIHDGCVGALYRNGTFAGLLRPGRHVRWGRHIHVIQIDQRKTLLTVNSQEVLSADQVAVKLSLVLTTEVVDPITALRTVQDHTTHLYSAAQLALRTVVARAPLETLLAQRFELATDLHQILAPQAQAIGVRLHAVAVRDVMLSGDLRKAFAETVKAKQEGLAALERARAETAGLRHLVNAARQVESVPALAGLRLIQMLERTQPAFVLNDLAALAPALTARPARTTGAEASPPSDAP